MKHKKKAIVAAALISTVLFGAESCENDSDVVSKNLSTDADNYKVFRQIVVYNGITGEYMLEVKGFCALGNEDSAGSVSYTCKVGGDMGSDGYIKDIIKKSDNVTVWAHQLEPVNVSPDYYKVTLKPTTIVPDFEFNSGK
jgi:hypothetical protein